MLQSLDASPTPSHTGSVWTTKPVSVLAALVLVAFTSGFMTARATESEATGLAPAWVVTLADDYFVAMNAHSVADLEAAYAEDAVLTDMATGSQTVGADQIADYLVGLQDMTVRRTSAIMYRDGYATFTFRFSSGSGYSPAVNTFKVEDGQISHQWVMSDEPAGFGI
jgi:hypothetical protein